MPRMLFPEDRIHPAIRDKISTTNREIVEEVAAAIAEHPLLVVGMKQNPYPRRARKLLTSRNIPFHYLSYGSYLSDWRRRTALKMWTGWSTFPMIWVKGQLIGGASDLQQLVDSGELERLLAA